MKNAFHVIFEAKKCFFYENRCFFISQKTKFKQLVRKNKHEIC